MWLNEIFRLQQRLRVDDHVIEPEAQRRDADRQPDQLGDVEGRRAGRNPGVFGDFVLADVEVAVTQGAGDQQTIGAGSLAEACREQPG